MRYVFPLLILFVLTAVCVVQILRGQIEAEGTDRNVERNQDSAAAEEEQPQPLLLSDDEPLLLSDEEPLLLMDEEAPLLSDDGMGADNSRCHVCHMNFAMEEIAVVHAKRDIGCGDCHGDCDAHIDDESWAAGGPGTPPGIMYPPENIDAACRECHDMHDVPVWKVLACWQKRCPTKTDAAKITCTDCHGNHRVQPELRNAWWDKRTGKPIKPESDNRVESGTD